MANRVDKIKIALIGGIITYGIKSVFYKHISRKSDDVFKKLLRRKFELIEIVYTDRLHYDIHPYRVYIIDFPKIIYKYFKQLVKADLIITPGYGAVLEPLIALITAKLRGVPVYIKDTHWYWKNTGLSRYFWYIYFKLLRHFNAVLVPGRASYSFWRRYGFKNIYIVHYYWLESLMNPCHEIPREYKVLREKHDLIILYLGRVIKKRGLDILVKAYKEFIKEYKGRPLLVIAGKGEYLDTLKKIITEDELTSKVLLLGPVPEEYKACLYGIADIFVYVPILTSIPEEWAVPPLEAMQLGKPVIVSSIVGVLPDIYPDVIVVKQGSIEELYNALKKLLDPETRLKLGMKAYNKVLEITPVKVYYELLKAIKNSIKKV